jgi:tetratricopeptide (TPR) repeat protein
VKVTDGFHLWSETYDRVLDDIFAVQEDIARSVATAMNVTLLGVPKPKSGGNAESFNLVLQGNFFASRITRESLERAKSLYQRAIDADPSDARAWAGLSRVLKTQAGYGFADVNEGFDSGKEAGLKALALDDALAEAHENMGWHYLAFDFDWKRAGDSFRRAYALAPGDSDVVTGLASYEANCGQLDEALRLTRESVELDPLNPSAYLYGAKVYYSARRYEKAVEFCGKALEFSPGIVSVHAVTSFVLVLMGRLDEALTHAQKEAPSGYRHFALAIAHHALGRKRDSNEALDSLLQEGEQWGFQTACAYAFRGEADQALEWLERSYAAHDSGISLVKMHPLLTNLHSDPRWPQFLQKIGLAL